MIRFWSCLFLVVVGASAAQSEKIFGKGIVTGSALSPDGKQLAVLAGNRVLLFDAERRQLISELASEAKSLLRAAVFDGKGERLAAVSADGTLFLWTLGKKPTRLSFDALPTDVLAEGVRFSLVFSAKGSSLFIRCERRGVPFFGVLWDVEERKALAGSDYIGRLSDDGRWLLPFEDERRFFHLPSRQWFQGIVAHSPKGLAFVAPEKPTLVQLVTSNTLEPLGYVRLVEGEVTRLALSRSRGVLGITLRRGEGSPVAAVWDVHARRDVEWRLLRDDLEGTLIAFVGESFALLRNANGSQTLRNLAAGETLSTFTHVTLSEDEKQLAGKNQQTGAVELWKEGETSPRTIPFRAVDSLWFSKDGRYLLAAVPGRTRPMVFDVENEQVISPAALTPSVLASCGLSFGVEELAKIPALSEGYAFAGRPLSSELIRLLPPPLQEWTRRWVISEGMNSCDALPPAVDSHYRDGYEILPEICWAYNRPARTWAIAVSEGEEIPPRIEGIRLWHNDTSDPLGTLEGHEKILQGRHVKYVHFLDFSRDGKYLVSAGHDRTARVWDFAARRLVATLKGHLAPVRFVAVAPDGSALLSGSEDGTVRLWSLP